jgi:hypothetical protein
VPSLAAVRWKNGGTSSGVSSVKFGTHDWILWKGYLLAKDEVDLAWLKTNKNYAFFGTEAPDLGKSKLRKSFRNQIVGNYKDTSPCHCILYDTSEDPFQPFAADRIEQEYDKAKAAIAAQDWKLAAFYVGAMAHYLGDLSQFMHLMGTGSRWNAEDQDVHADYEKVFEARIKYQNKTLAFVEPYITPATVSATTPRNIAFEVAKFTDTGGGTVNTPGHMYQTYLGYESNGIKAKPDQWDQDFLDQSGHNINKAVNAVSALLKKLMQEQ